MIPMFLKHPFHGDQVTIPELQLQKFAFVRTSSTTPLPQLKASSATKRQTYDATVAVEAFEQWLIVRVPVN